MSTTKREPRVLSGDDDVVVTRRELRLWQRMFDDQLLQQRINLLGSLRRKTSRICLVLGGLIAGIIIALIALH